MKLLRIVTLLALVSCLSSCAGVVNIQPQVNGLATAGRFDQALQVLEDPAKYGKNNQLLFKFDKGMVLHLAGRYQESTDVFEEAKLQYEQLYTQSVSKGVGSWLWNDYALPYRGEDFERVMLNIFEAMNFAAAGDIEGALVEARDVDSTLNAINQQYSEKQKNVYRDDAFARLLMGMFYEASGNVNDALISYRMAWTVYDRDYKKHYGLSAPLILKENLLAAAEKFGDFDLAQYRRLFPDVNPLSWDEKKKKGEIIVVEYAGLSPLKIPVQIPIPMPDGYISQLAFPQYQKRDIGLGPSAVFVNSVAGGETLAATTEIGEDIASIAVKNLEDRKVRVIAKAVVRLAGKYAVERGIEYSLEKDHGKGTAGVMKIVGSLFNIISEQADLRSWQTLPAEIRIARVFVDPGQYEVTTGSQRLGQVEISAGEKKFLIVRSVR